MPHDPRPSDYDNDRAEPADDRDDPPRDRRGGRTPGHPGRSPWMDDEPGAEAEGQPPVPPPAGEAKSPGKR